MSLHFVSHPWDVRDVEDGLLVTLTQRDLDWMTVPATVDELYDLVLENGHRNLHLDFGQVQYIASIIIAKLLVLETRLNRVGGRVVLTNLDPAIQESLDAARVSEEFDIRAD